jgi:hypothetical protein
MRKVKLMLDEILKAVNLAYKEKKDDLMNEGACKNIIT